ncbi:MAG: cell division protein FtsQ/DivIB, partial [Acetobacteraceae bacterium]
MPRGVKGARAPRNSVRDRPAGWLLLLRRQRWLARPALALGAIGLVLLGLTALLRSGAPGSLLGQVHLALARAAAKDGLVVRHVIVEGRANTPAAILQEAMDVHRGMPILAVPIRAVAQRIDRLSWVQSATVERRLPDTIVIRLTERRPFAIWQ